MNGAVIDSTATADKNRLDTGTLGFSNIENKAEFKTEHQGGSISTAGSVADDFLGNMDNLVLVPTGTKIWLVAGTTDMRCGFHGLASKVQNTLTEAACMVHVRRKIHDVHARHPTAITTEALIRFYRDSDQWVWEY